MKYKNKETQEVVTAIQILNTPNSAMAIASLIDCSAKLGKDHLEIISCGHAYTTPYGHWMIKPSKGSWRTEKDAEFQRYFHLAQDGVDKPAQPLEEVPTPTLVQKFEAEIIESMRMVGAEQMIIRLFGQEVTVNLTAEIFPGIKSNKTGDPHFNEMLKSLSKTQRDIFYGLVRKGSTITHAINTVTGADKSITAKLWTNEEKSQLIALVKSGLSFEDAILAVEDGFRIAKHFDKYAVDPKVQEEVEKANPGYKTAEEAYAERHKVADHKHHMKWPAEVDQGKKLTKEQLDDIRRVASAYDYKAEEERINKIGTEKEIDDAVAATKPDGDIL